VAPTDGRALPRATPETADFWAGTAVGELRLQRCRPHGHVYFPPQPFCPRCSSSDVETFPATGHGRVYSYVISYLKAPGFEPPYVLAVVEFDEGPRLLTNVIDVEPTPDALPIDMGVTVAFTECGDVVLPLFRPEVAP
jgi:uncharacterized OB-fold protein